jgi:GMP synthase-like glutamine amidotransferase
MQKPQLAILTTWEGDVPFTARHPDDGEKVRAGLAPWLPDWDFRVWRVSQGDWPADDAPAPDAWLITGSPASVNDDSPWIHRLMALLARLHAQRQPMVGLCFGHQALAKALGGQVGLSAGGWRMGTAPLPLHTPQPWMQPPRPALSLYAAHCEQVLALPPGAQAVGGDDFCPVGAMAIGGHVFSTQYHPEFSAAFMADALDSMQGKLPDEVVATGRQQITRPADGPLLMQWIANFLRQAAPASTSLQRL